MPLSDVPSSPRRRLPARYNAIVMPLVLSLLMSCIVSGVATLHSVGLNAEFPVLWMQAWPLSWMVAFPTLLVVLPVVRRLVALVVEPAG
jgi:hypothetical protein